MMINEWLQQQENIFCTSTRSKPCYLRSSLDKKKKKIEPESDPASIFQNLQEIHS